MKQECISNININFDSLNRALQTNPCEFEDSTFITMPDRFLKMVKKYDFKYLAFVIGKNLGNPVIAKLVKEWQDQGHAVGNYTCYNKLNFGSLSYDEPSREVMATHAFIKSASDPIVIFYYRSIILEILRGRLSPC